MKKYILLVLSTLLLFTTSCEDWLKEKNIPKLSYDYYSTEAGVEAAIIAAYSFLRWQVGGERWSNMEEYGTDLFTEGEDGNYREMFNQYTSAMNPDVNILYELWENHYKAIADCNVAMQKIAESDILKEDKKKQYNAEIQFLRSLFYFDLVQQFGKIPLETEDTFSFDIRTSFKRAEVSEVYNQIITDLENAVKDLPETTSQKGRATKYAAAHLLSKIYLTRGSAVTEQRGQQSTDMSNALKYAEMVLNSDKYKLVDNFKDLFDITNQGNSEVVFAVQFTSNQTFNGNGNKLHLYYGCWYEDQPGMRRDILNGRPWRRHRATEFVLFDLFDRINDSRLYKSFQWTFIANNQETLPKWTELSDNGQVYFTPDPNKGQIKDEYKFQVGDTAIFYSLEKTGLSSTSLDMKKLRAEYSYSYFPFEVQNIRYFPQLIKHLDPTRISVAEEQGSREWVRMRLGETYLLAAEAAGRTGDFEKAAEYINKIRERAAWKEGEQKSSHIGRFDGGENNTEGTYDRIKVTPDDLKQNFVDFMLDERGRELLGELMRWSDLVRCEKLLERAKKYNSYTTHIKDYHKLRPIPQKHIDRLNPQGQISEEQNVGYY